MKRVLKRNRVETRGNAVPCVVAEIQMKRSVQSNKLDSKEGTTIFSCVHMLPTLAGPREDIPSYLRCWLTQHFRPPEDNATQMVRCDAAVWQVNWQLGSWAAVAHSAQQGGQDAV